LSLRPWFFFASLREIYGDAINLLAKAQRKSEDAKKHQPRHRTQQQGGDPGYSGSPPLFKLARVSRP
jgi:hypothetical protein